MNNIQGQAARKAHKAQHCWPPWVDWHNIAKGEYIWLAAENEIALSPSIWLTGEIYEELVSASAKLTSSNFKQKRLKAAYSGNKADRTSDVYVC